MKQQYFILFFLHLVSIATYANTDIYSCENINKITLKMITEQLTKKLNEGKSEQEAWEEIEQWTNNSLNQTDDIMILKENDYSSRLITLQFNEIIYQDNDGSFNDVLCFPSTHISGIRHSLSRSCVLNDSTIAEITINKKSMGAEVYIADPSKQRILNSFDQFICH